MAGVRRTWDKEYYAQKAQDRLEFGDDFVDSQDKSNDLSSSKLRKVIREEFKSAEPDAEGPVGSNKAFIQARDYRLELEHKAGKVEVINPLAEESAKAGFWCEVCKCLLKDSASYLDHINGKKHQAALGFSMRVEKADINAVKQRLDALKRKVGGGSKSTAVFDTSQLSAIEEKVKVLAHEEEEKQEFKRRRKEERKQQKEHQHSLQDNQSNEKLTARRESVWEEQVENVGDDEEFKQIFGFEGFRSSKK